MATKIEWTRNASGELGETWNPIVAYRWVDDPDSTGCSGMKRLRGWYCEHATTGCINCYSEKQNVTGARGGTKLPYKPGHRKDIEIELHEPTLLKPLHWKKPRTIFVCSMTDLFGEFHSDQMIDRVFAVMALCPQHTFQVLTKRAERMRDYFRPHDRGAKWAFAIKKFERQMPSAETAVKWGRAGLPNCWLGTSAERQQEADERIPHLLQTPAAIRFVSYEPALGPVDLREIDCGGGVAWNALGKGRGGLIGCLDWVIAGGESGPNARPMHPDWARSLRDQCAVAGVAFFFKQWGAWAPGNWSGSGDPGFFDAFDPSLTTPDMSDHGAWCGRVHWFDASTEPDGLGAIRVGKKAAGRLLDGREWNEMPTGAPA